MRKNATKPSAKYTAKKDKAADKVLVPSEADQAIVDFVVQCNKDGVTYRDKFAGTWNKI